MIPKPFTEIIRKSRKTELLLCIEMARGGHLDYYSMYWLQKLYQLIFKCKFYEICGGIGTEFSHDTFATVSYTHLTLPTSDLV